RLNLSFTKVVAPIDGRIGRNLADRGTLVSADQTVLATIVNDSKVYVYFSVTDREMLDYIRQHPEVRNADPAQRPQTWVFVQLAGEEGYPHRGRVDSGDNRVDATTGTYQVRAVFDNPRSL